MWILVVLLFSVTLYGQNTRKTGCVSGTCGTGWGTYVFSNGEYTGEFKDGKQEGHGTYTWNNGDIYEGSWLAGKRNGTGTFTWSNGVKFQGQWESDQRSGPGLVTDKNGLVVKQGNWYNNEYYRKLYGKVKACRLFISNNEKIAISVIGTTDTITANSDGTFIVEFSEKIKYPVLNISGPVVFGKTFEIGNDTMMNVCLNPRYRKGILAAPLFGPVFYGRSINRNYILTAAFTDVFGILALTYGLINYGDYKHNLDSYNMEYERYSTLTDMNEIRASHDNMEKLYDDINHSWNRYVAGTVTGGVFLAASVVIRIIAIASPNAIKITGKKNHDEKSTETTSVSITPLLYTQKNFQHVGMNINF